MRKLMVAGAAVLAVAIAAMAGSQVRIVRFSYLSHGVEVGRAEPPSGIQTWKAAAPNQPLVEGDIIRTGQDGSAEVELECGSFLRLTPGTALTASELRRGDDGVPESVFTLSAGTLYATFQKGDTQGLRLQFPSGAAAIPDGAAAMRAEAEPNGGATVELLDGKAAVQTDSRTVALAKHHRLRLGPGGGAAETAPAPQDPWWRWSRKRDEAFHRLLISEGPAPPPALAIPFTGPNPAPAELARSAGLLDAPVAMLPSRRSPICRR